MPLFYPAQKFYNWDNFKALLDQYNKSTKSNWKYVGTRKIDNKKPRNQNTVINMDLKYSLWHYECPEADCPVHINLVADNWQFLFIKTLNLEHNHSNPDMELEKYKMVNGFLSHLTSRWTEVDFSKETFLIEAESIRAILPNFMSNNEQNSNPLESILLQRIEEKSDTPEDMESTSVIEQINNQTDSTFGSENIEIQSNNKFKSLMNESTSSSNDNSPQLFKSKSQSRTSKKPKIQSSTDNSSGEDSSISPHVEFKKAQSQNKRRPNKKKEPKTRINLNNDGFSEEEFSTGSVLQQRNNKSYPSTQKKIAQIKKSHEQNQYGEFKDLSTLQKDLELSMSDSDEANGSPEQSNSKLDLVNLSPSHSISMDDNSLSQSTQSLVLDKTIHNEEQSMVKNRERKNLHRMTANKETGEKTNMHQNIPNHTSRHGPQENKKGSGKKIIAGSNKKPKKTDEFDQSTQNKKIYDLKNFLNVDKQKNIMKQPKTHSQFRVINDKTKGEDSSKLRTKKKEEIQDPLATKSGKRKAIDDVKINARTKKSKKEVSEKLGFYDKHEITQRKIILQWMGLPEKMINKVISKEYIISKADIKNIILKDSFRVILGDDNKAFRGSLGGYFEEDAWLLIIKKYEKLKSSPWLCCICKKLLEKDQTRCIICLLWFHDSCADKERLEKGLCKTC